MTLPLTPNYPLVKILMGWVLFNIPIYAFTQKERFDFIETRWNNKVSLKKGKTIDLVKIINDTTYRFTGDLITKNDSTIELALFVEETLFKTDSLRFDQAISYENEKILTFDSSQFDYIRYENSAVTISGNLIGLGLFTGAFIAPLASIDRSKPYYFNTKKFTKIALPALCVFGVGFTVGIFSKSYKLRLY